MAAGSRHRWKQAGDGAQGSQGWLGGRGRESGVICVDQEDVREGQGSHRWLWMRVLLGIRPGSVPRRQEGRSQSGDLTKPACYALRDGVQGQCFPFVPEKPLAGQCLHGGSPYVLGDLLMTPVLPGGMWPCLLLSL